MSESIESYLDDVRTEAWSEHVYPRPAVDELAAPPLDGAFSRVARVYERELRRTAEERVMTVRVADESLQAASKARDIAYELRFREPDESTAREELDRLIAELDKVLGPDLVREADPTGEVLKPLPFEERKRMLDSMIDSPVRPDYVRAVQNALELAEARGDRQPPTIIIVEDEASKLMADRGPRAPGYFIDEAAGTTE